jgi:F-type H+-transporting ATPase subunit b
MRIRRLIVAGVIAAAPAVANAAPALAAGGGEKHETIEVIIGDETITLEDAHIGECHGEELAALIKAEGEERVNLLEDCFSEKSPILPKWPEVIWGGIAWLLVVLLVGKFALPQLKKTMQARSDKIRGDLEAAEAAKQSANMELEQYRAQLADARNEAARIVDAARQDADAVKRDLIAAAEAEAAQVRTRAQADIALAQDRALADLRTQVASMSVELAGKIVERNLDPATQQALIDSYINSVGSN